MDELDPNYRLGFDAKCALMMVSRADVEPAIGEDGNPLVSFTATEATVEVNVEDVALAIADRPGGLHQLLLHVIDQFTRLNADESQEVPQAILDLEAEMERFRGI